MEQAEGDAEKVEEEKRKFWSEAKLKLLDRLLVPALLMLGYLFHLADEHHLFTKAWELGKGLFRE